LNRNELKINTMKTKAFITRPGMLLLMIAGDDDNARMSFVLQHVEASGNGPEHYDAGTTTTLVAKAKVSGSIGDKSDELSSTAGGAASASAWLGANFDSGWRFNADGRLVGKYKSANFDAGVGTSAQASMSNSLGSKSASTSKSAKAHGAVDAIATVQSDGSYSSLRRNSGKR
jgi:hypothetical protein